jgi:hypothetical protein
VKVAASTVWDILNETEIDPAPERAASTWAALLRSQADALLACDFLEAVTLTGARMCVFAVIEHASRRIHILGATPHPTTGWVVHFAKNLVMDLEDNGSRARFMVRDRDGKFPELFDAILAEVGIDVVLSGVHMPRMNSIMERWVQTCRHELLDRTLIWNQRHLLHALHEFEQFYNGHRPHQGIANARPLCPLPTPITDPDKIAPRHTKTRSPWRHPPRVRACCLTCTDEVFGKSRALLAALLQPLPRRVLRHIRVLVRPETVLRWHRDLIAARHARISRCSGPQRSARSPPRSPIRTASLT